MDELKNEYKKFLLTIQQNYLSNRNDSRYQKQYLVVANLYRLLLEVNTMDELIQFRSSVESRARKTYEKEAEIKQKSLSAKTKEEQEKLLKQKAENKAIFDIYGITNKLIVNFVKSKRATNINETNPAQNTSQKSTSEINELNNEDIVLSSKIISLLEKLNQMDQNTTEAQKIKEAIFTLREQRENKYRILYGENCWNFISSIESYENRIALAPQNKLADKKVSSEEYLSKLKEIIKAINEYNFINQSKNRKYYQYDKNLSNGKNESNFYKKYQLYQRMYNVLIKSLFNDEFNLNKDGSDISKDDILSYLTTWNLNRDYNAFKEKYSGTNLGNIDKKTYEANCDYLYECLNYLYNQAKTKLNGNSIVLKDTEPTKEDLINSRNKLFKQMYLSIQNQRNNEKGMTL